MSIAQPSLEQDTLDKPSSKPEKPPRVLACVLCQQRKVRCDRKFPCTNCVKSGAQCIPATLTPRRRRRVFPERELLARVRHYENLLHQNNVNFEPLRKDPSGEYESPQQTEAGYESEKEQPDSVSAGQSSRQATTSPQGVYQAKYFKETDTFRSLWQAMRQEDDDDEFTNENVSEAHMKEIWDQATRDSDHLLFGVRNSAVDLSTLHPEPVQIFRLWQIYLDNVNPLFKVIHTPSLQRSIIETASNISDITPELEALMFSIYCISVSSLSTEICQAIFKFSKKDILTRFHFGCQQALQNCRFLQTSDRHVLTALFHYLVSLGFRTNPRSMSSMLGIAIRIAERMGIHDEAICTKLTVIEAEMGRRLWWSLKLFDIRIGELADYKSASLGTIWDCHIPLNVNDSDLCPEMTRSPEAQGTPTEALFVVVRGMLGDFVRHSTLHLDFISPAMRNPSHSHGSAEDGLGALEKMIEERYLRYCDPDNSLHFMTMWTIRGHLARCHLIEHYSKHLGSHTKETDEQRDTAVSYALDILECDTKVMTSPLTKGFVWIYQFYFPFIAYNHVTKELKRRPLCEQAERAWGVMNENYDARIKTRATSNNPMYEMFSNIVLNAWEACEAIMVQKGKPLSLPRMVMDIRLKREQKAASAKATYVEEPSDGLPVDRPMHNDPMSVLMSTDLGAPSGAPQTEGQGVGLDGYSNTSERSLLDDSIYQIDWASLNWTGYRWPSL